MSRRVLQAAAVTALCAACQSEGSAQPESSGERPFTTTEVARFDAPWAMAFLPGSGLPLTSAALVTEKTGALWLVDTKNGSRAAVAGAPRVTVNKQGGLADVVAHPDFAGNHRIYLSYAEPGPDGTSGGAIGYGRLVLGSGQPRIDGFRVIWRQPKVRGSIHYSARIAFAPDGTMFISSGERGRGAPAQDASSDLGKVIHMTVEGQRIGGRFYTMGHRNVLGLSFAADGRLWASEMGPQGGDEINLILAGRNYGWPRASNGSNYGGGSIPDHKAGDGFEAPKVWWTPSISPGALLIYNGNKFPQWKGDALVGALSGEALIRVDIDGDRARKADQWPMNARIRAIDEGPDGSVYLLEDGESGGRMLRLDPR